MASQVVVEYCENRFRDGLDYKIRTQDFSDEVMRKAFQLVKPYCWEDIGDYLAKLTDDPEVLAHLKGFESAQERAEMIAMIKRKQERMKQK